MNFWLTEFKDAYADQRILVTGASGFVGRNLCDALGDLGAEVHALHRREIGKHADNHITHLVDMQDFDLLRRVVSEIRPQIVYHLAGYVTARQEIDLVMPMLHANLVGTVNLLLCLTEIDCQQVVTIRSSEEPTDGMPTSPYAASKAAAALYVGLFQQLYKLPVKTATLFTSFGPYQSEEKLIPYLIRSYLRGDAPRLSSGDGARDFIHIHDVVRGLLMLGTVRELNGESVDFGTGTSVSIREIALLTATLIDDSTKPEFGAVADRQHERSRLADPARTQTMLGWTPCISLEDGLRQTIEWYKEN